MEKCLSLSQYAEFVRRMREALDSAQEKEQRRKAAARVIDQAIDDGILSDVLCAHRNEVVEMYYWEYDEEAHHWAIEQDAKEEGRAIDVTGGRKTRAVLVADTGHVILCAMQTETVTARLNGTPDAAEDELSDNDAE